VAAKELAFAEPEEKVLPVAVAVAFAVPPNIAVEVAVAFAGPLITVPKKVEMLPPVA
jgi:hypothetical protein